MMTHRHHIDYRDVIHESCHGVVAIALGWRVSSATVQKVHAIPPGKIDPYDVALICLSPPDLERLGKAQLIRMIDHIRAGTAHKLPASIYSDDHLESMRALMTTRHLDEPHADLIRAYKLLRKEAHHLCRMHSDQVISMARGIAKQERWRYY